MFPEFITKHFLSVSVAGLYAWLLVVCVGMGYCGGGLLHETQVVLEKGNYEYTAQGLVGKGTSVYTFGMGGMATPNGLLGEAKLNLLKKHPLKDNEALVNMTTETRMITFFGIIIVRKAIITADVIKFTDSQKMD